MSGQAAVAVAVSGVQVASAAASVWGKPRTFQGDDTAEEHSAFTFFALSTLFLVVSAGAHAWMVRMPVYEHITAPLERQKIRTIGVDAHEDERLGLISGRRGNLFAHEKANALRIAKLNISYEVAGAYVFIVTLVSFPLPRIMRISDGTPQAVFPPITTSIQPTNPAVHPLLFSAIHFLVFNVGDFLGRYTCSFRMFMIWSSQHLLTLSLARTLFIPLFLMCNIQSGSSTITYNPIISSDVLFMVILFVFGWSNGYIASSCMMAAPSLEHNPRLKGRAEDVDVAATVASFCLVVGLAVGSVASFAVKSVICKCNPFTN